MLKGRKSVLDEREMLEMYRVEHFGLWLMYGLLCAAVVVQMRRAAKHLHNCGYDFHRENPPCVYLLLIIAKIIVLPTNRIRAVAAFL